MTIDHLMIESLMTWARAQNGGKPVMLQIGRSAENSDNVVCDAYTLHVSGSHPFADYMRPIARSVIGKL